MQILNIENLSLHYGTQKVLNNISFSIKKGQIIGLLGPNGAGKSSILRILAGLVFPESGSLNIYDVPQSSFSNLRAHCGYMIDSPSFYPFLSAKQNLNLIKKINKSSVNLDELLLNVGLQETGSKKVKNFSMGMKQRLAIAQALLRSPEILILDEPFNGLDPNGFQDLINLLKDLNSKGITILVSSHLLNELEQLADYFILLHHGNVALDISKKDLLKSKNTIAFTFLKEPTSKALLFLKELKAVREEDLRVLIKLNPIEIPTIIEKLVEMQSTPIEVDVLTILQEKYLEITD